MKRDEEFLKGMWQKVAVLEEEFEREIVLQRNKEIKKKQLLIFISFAVLFIGMCAAYLFVSMDASAIIVLSIAMIIASIKIEFSAMKTSIKVS